MSFEPSLARRGLDALLERYSPFDVIEVDYQRPRLRDDEDKVIRAEPAGPWITVSLGQPSESFEETMPIWSVWRFAIFKRTGNVYMVGPDGAVEDDPFIVVS